MTTSELKPSGEIRSEIEIWIMVRQTHFLNVSSRTISHFACPQVVTCKDQQILKVLIDLIG